MPIKIEVSPNLGLVLNGHTSIDPVLLQLLRHLQLDGRLTVAVQEMGLSYRHGWNIIRKWNELFGQPVVLQQRGQGTRLSPLGEKLVWAEQLIEAKLGPQVANLGSVITRELGTLFGEEGSRIQIHASHGYAIALLYELLEKQHQAVVMRYTGSVSAVEALNKGQCEVAGFHVPVHPLLALQARKAYLGHLSRRHHVIVRMVLRNQGLIVPSGNPRQIHHLVTLTDKNIRFINRQASAGTRVLLDCLLDVSGIETSDIQGYEQEEYTHSAVAAYVASGSADVGFGIEYAARKFGLDFVPIVQEQYSLACDRNWLLGPVGKALLNVLQGNSFREGVALLPGYQLSAPGEVLSVDEWQNSDLEP